jgi:HD-GYP domain-containing protein (c-di-GMP phosphodiesterase class II)
MEAGILNALNGQSAPLGVRIVHVADVFDAITSNRAYRKAMSREDVLAIMMKGAGKQFDPAVLAVFFDILNQGKLVQAMLDDAEVRTTFSDSKFFTTIESFSK